MPKIDKALRRDAARERARTAPRGGMSDSRPEAVRLDRGAARRMMRVLDRNRRGR